MAKKVGIEGRRTPRRSFSRPLGVLWRGQYRVCRAIQISEGGMLFSTTVKIETNDKIVITAIVDSTESLIVSAEVLYEAKGTPGSFSYGVRFIDLPLNQRRMIRNYVSAKTLEEAELEVDEMQKAS